MKWTCKGSVRGECGKTHRSWKTAFMHCEKDDRDVERGHGKNAYSDRTPVPIDDEARAQHEAMKTGE